MMKRNELINLLSNLGEKISIKGSKFYNMTNNDIKNSLESSLKSFTMIYKDITMENIIGVIDASNIRSCSDGLIFTDKSFYIRSRFEKTICIEYNDIKDLKLIKVDKKDNKKNYIIIETSDNIVQIKNNYIDKDELYKFLELIKNSASDYNINKVVILRDMSDIVKENYLRIVISYCRAGGILNASEFSRLQSLMNRMNASEEVRKRIINYTYENNIEELLDEMDKNIIDSSLRDIHVSLVRDMLKTEGHDISELNSDETELLLRLSSKCNLSEEEIKNINNSIIL